MPLISFRESQRIVHDLSSTLRSSAETINTRDSLHRVLCENIFALRSNPSCELAAMDGIAVNTSQINSYPVRFESDQWERINTGDIVSSCWNAIVKIEDVEWENETAVISKQIVPLQHIRTKGEDFSEGSLLFSAGKTIYDVDLSLLLTAGHGTVKVLRKPIITFLPTGTELITETIQKKENSVLESNSAMIAAAVNSWGGIFKLALPVADEVSAMKAAIRQAVAESDIVVVSAGTSMGTRDLTASVIGELGNILFHGVALHPAKPVLLAQIGDVPILGLPGYPVAAYIASLYFLEPLVTAISGTIRSIPQEVHISAEDIPAKAMDTIYRVNLFDVDGRIYVRKISGGAGSILSLSKMDAFMHVPADTTIHKRDAVRVNIIQNRASNTIAIRGTFDPLFNRAWDLYRQAQPQHRVLFWDAPEEEALQSIIERNCHLAIIHTSMIQDLFPEFAKQLQENMFRYRIFSRTIALAASQSSKSKNRIVIPSRNLDLWTQLAGKYLDLNNVEELVVDLNDEAAVRWIPDRSDLGIFADIRFLKDESNFIFEVQEHFDLIVSETYADQPSIKKLIELLLSPQFGEWIDSFRGCNTGSRGLLHETYDV